MSKFLLGGLLAGAGTGMVAQDKVDREEAEKKRQEALLQARELASRGDVVATKTDAQGNVRGITRGGQATDPLFQEQGTTIKDPTSVLEFKARQQMSPEEQLEYDAFRKKNNPTLSIGADGTIVYGDAPLDKSVSKAAQEKVISAGESLARLQRIKDTYKPEYLTYQGKAENYLSSIKSKAGVDLSPQEKEDLQQRRKFTQAVNYDFNQYRKEITGAAAAVSELENLKKAALNDDLGPDEFEAAFSEYVEERQRSLRIYNKLLREGLKPGTKQFGSALDQLFIGSGDDDINARGDELEANGLSEEQVLEQLKLEGYY